ncbi:MAG: hypothetical protein ACYDAR_01190 [Thermomicrobiales bacterium]
MKRDEPARDSVIGIIHQQQITPGLDRATIVGWPDGLLEQVAIAWVRAEIGEAWLPPDGMPPLEGIRAAIRDYVQRQQEDIDRAMTHMLRPVQDLVKPLQEQVATIAQSISQTYRPPWADVTPTLQSLAQGFDLPGVQSFLNAHRTALDLAAINTPSVSSLFERWLPTIPTMPTVSTQWPRFDVGATSVASFTAAFDGLQDSAARIVEAARTAMGNIQPTIGEWFPRFEIGNLFPALPDLTDLIPQMEAMRRADESLQASGFGFTGHLWSWSFLVTFATNASDQVRGAAVTNRMLAVIREEAFQKELCGSIARSTVLRRREKIVERALAAHLRRDYVLSIPALLTQLEGIVGDALILKGMVCARGHKLYARLPDGRIQLQQKGKQRGHPVEVRGLGELVQRSGFRQHEALDLAAELIVAAMVKERNGILHGRHTRYGTAKLSTQLLLLLYAFAREIAAFEAGEVTWREHAG